MPLKKFMKNSHELRHPKAILDALQERHPKRKLRYIELARRRGSRIRKFSRYPRSLDKWRRVLNEPSHFVNPGSVRKTSEHHIYAFVEKVGDLFRHPDGFLITAAVNQIRSGGTVQALLGPEPDNIPGIQLTSVVTPNNLYLIDDHIGIKGPKCDVQVIPDTKDVPYRWRNKAVVVQHSYGMRVQSQLVTRAGRPLDITNIKTILQSFMVDPHDRRLLVRRLRQLGFEVVLHRDPSTSNQLIRIERKKN